MTTKAKASKSAWTENDSLELSKRYQANPTKETVAAIAKESGRSERSVIAKLVSLKLYQSAAKPEAGKAGEKKAEIVAKIALALDMPEETLSSLESASKTALSAIAAALAKPEQTEGETAEA